MKAKRLLNTYRRPLIVLTHLLLIVLAYICAFSLRFDLHISVDYWQVILKTLPILVAVKLLIFFRYRLFEGLWRYVSTDDLWRIIKANVFSTAAFIAGVMFAQHTLAIRARCLSLISYFVRAWSAGYGLLRA